MTLKRFSGPSGLSPLPTPILHKCSGDQQHCDKAKAVGIPHMDIQALKEFNRNKKLAKKYNVVLPSESDQVDPTNVGPRPEGGWQVPFLADPQ